MFLKIKQEFEFLKNPYAEIFFLQFFVGTIIEKNVHKFVK
jgi:hypothetical protein